jgi:Xaa-Pro aminopeptidase
MPTAVDPNDLYPRFSDQELDRRRRAVLAAMDTAGASHLVVYGANRFGSAVPWLTGWPVTREALLLVAPDLADVLFVQFHNHVPNASDMASRCEVRWGGRSTVETVVGELGSRRARGRVGIIGPITAELFTALASRLEVVDLNGVYTQMRLTKSDEEIEWVRMGVEMTDRGIDALRREARPGLTEHQLADVVERAYVPMGGGTLIHYFGVTSMAAPDRFVPAQHTSMRRLHPGDALTTEISASFWDYPGQALRTFSVAADPAPLYLELHRVAEAAFDAIVQCLRAGTHAAEVVAAASVIEEAGFTTYDDLVHGFVGGYLPPILGSRSRTLWEIPDARFEAGMTVVVQPNVVTRDHRAGVQTGELVLVTEEGVERLHTAPAGLHRIGD